jgi:hypothetical protein
MKSFMYRFMQAVNEIGTIEKKSDNPFFKSKYVEISAMLERIQPILFKHGLVLSQPSVVINGQNIQQSVVSDSESDKCLTSSLQMPEISDPQKVVAATTYFRRATLQNLLSLQTVDDDGNEASGKQQPKISKPQAKRNNDF